MEVGPIRSNSYPDEGPDPVYECAIDEWSSRLSRWICGDTILKTMDLSKAERWFNADLTEDDLRDLEIGLYRKVIRSAYRDCCGEMAYNLEESRKFNVVKERGTAVNGIHRIVTRRLSESELDPAKGLTHLLEIRFSREELAEIKKAADNYTDGDIEAFARFCIINYFKRFGGRY